MGSDDLFKKRRATRPKRKHSSIKPRANSYLIITEGKCTEPLYFRGLQKHIKEHIGGQLDVVEVPVLKISGEGCSTCKLVEKADEIINKASVIYQNVWVLFDKDDFQDFDEAIKLAKRKGYHVGWSNQSFEYWLCLHFDYCDAALHRNGWNTKLNDIFKKQCIGNGKYEKNIENIYDIVSANGGVVMAINHSKRRMGSYDAKIKPSQFDPGNTVYLLVQELLKYLEE